MWRLPAILFTALALVGGSVASGGTAVALPGGPGLDHDMRVITGYFNDHPMHRGEFGGLSFVQGHPGTLHVSA